jgi:hypothetical protein
MEATPPPAPAALERLGRYRIVRPLSKGGMALVYEARRESLAGVSPRVAIKLILPEYTSSGAFQELFINEARLGASMHHQNLVQIQDFDQDGDRFFLVMEYVEGITLRRAISLCRKSNVHVPLGVIAEVGRQACDGLDYAHRATDEHGTHLELVHRDVKPSNLILNPHGTVKLVDFGISRGRRLAEKKGTVKGTWGYMAPEQARGDDVVPATDVFGMAVVLYELAAKQPLFPDKTPEVVRRLLVDDHAARMAAVLDPSYGPLIPTLMRALQRDPSARYQTATEFGRALSAMLPDPISARDEVVRFYEGVDALHRGLPIPEGTLATESPDGESSASSLGAAPRPAEREGLPIALLVAAVSGLGLLIALVAVVAVLMTMPATDADGGPDGGVSVAEALRGAPLAPEPQPAAANDVAAPEPVLTERPPPADSIPPVTSTVAPRSAPVGSDAAVTPVVGAPREAAAPAPGERRVVVVRRPPEPAAADAVALPVPAPAATSPDPTPPDATGPGFLTVGSRQVAEVYVDGRFVRRVPLVRRELTPGVHVVTIQAIDGRSKSFDVEVVAGQEIRRVWDFDRGEWRP